MLVEVKWVVRSVWLISLSTKHHWCKHRVRLPSSSWCLLFWQHGTQSAHGVQWLYGGGRSLRHSSLWFPAAEWASVLFPFILARSRLVRANLAYSTCGDVCLTAWLVRRCYGQRSPDGPLHLIQSACFLFCHKYICVSLIYWFWLKNQSRQNVAKFDMFGREGGAREEWRVDLTENPMRTPATWHRLPALRQKQVHHC